jgi:pyruvate,water dikinase
LVNLAYAIKESMSLLQSIIVPFEECSKSNIESVGGKNAALGELMNALNDSDFCVPEGFVLSSKAFRLFLEHNQLSVFINEELRHKPNDYAALVLASERIQKRIYKSSLPQEIVLLVAEAYKNLCDSQGDLCSLAVRSSASAEDLPQASFAGIHDSYLNVRSESALFEAILSCYASLYSVRAIQYRQQMHFEHDKVLLSLGVQRMVRADLGSSGVCFSIDPDSGFRDAIVITAAWGLGESIVQGLVVPDEFHVFKKKLNKATIPILSHKLGSKGVTQIFDEKRGGTIATETPMHKQIRYCIADEEVLLLAHLTQKIESFYGFPVDVEWAKDGITGKIYIVQARPETVKSRQNPYQIKEFKLLEKSTVLCSGYAVGQGIVSARVRILKDTSDAHLLCEGEILVTETTNPDWDPILKKAAAIITCKGGRTSHAAIIAREMGTLALVGASAALDAIVDGQEVTIDCSLGKMGNVYDGKLRWDEHILNIEDTRMPSIKPQFILADPEQAYALSFFPSAGVGLMRLEFIIAGAIRIHPMALLHREQIKNSAERNEINHLIANYDEPQEYFIEKLSEAVGTIAAAFYPREVIVRMSDFKSNEYAQLIGGSEFEAKEENPMLGLRGASRYYNERYKEGFLLECKAMRRVREDMGLHNVKLMIPFCRTPEEGYKVIELMKQAGLKRGENGLQIFVMAEIPSNVLQAGEFARIFDGFSIGSNDLTQLSLGIDRDAADISNLFDENNETVKQLIAQLITKAKTAGVKVGLCGQGASDSNAFIDFLVEHHIDTISFTPDALIKGIEAIKNAESKISIAV